MSEFEVALAACRFLQDGSAMLLWGGFAFLAALVPTGLADSTDRKLDSLRLVSITVALIATAAMLPLRAADVRGSWGFAFDPMTLNGLLFDTRIGSAWQFQAVAAIALGMTALLPETARRPATATAAGLLLTSLALTGHAVSQSGWLGFVHRIADAVHLLCGGAWLGALLPLLFALAALKNSELRTEAVSALRRFSSAGHVAVAGVIATGAFNTWLVLRHASVDCASPYQRLLVCKLALVAAMTALAIGNRYHWVPQLQRHPASALRAIRRATIGEVALGLSAVALVAAFGLLEPM